MPPDVDVFVDFTLRAAGLGTALVTRPPQSAESAGFLARLDNLAAELRPS